MNNFVICFMLQNIYIPFHALQVVYWIEVILCFICLKLVYLMLYNSMTKEVIQFKLYTEIEPTAYTSTGLVFHFSSTTDAV